MFGCGSTGNEWVPGLASSMSKSSTINNSKKRVYPHSPTVTVLQFDYPQLSPQQHHRPQPQQERATTVSFHPRVTIAKCLHVSDYTAEERYQTWYTLPDLKAMKRQCKKLLEGEAVVDNVFASDDSCRSKIIHPPPPPPPREGDDDAEDKENMGDNHNSSNNNSKMLPYAPPMEQQQQQESNHCFRGLEGKTVEGQIKKRMLKENARRVVFLEQQRQVSFGFDDPYAISYEYHKATQFARNSALRLGVQDEEEALNWLCTDDLWSTSNNSSNGGNGSKIVFQALD